MTDLAPNPVTGAWQGPNIYTATPTTHQFAVMFRRDGSLLVGRRNRNTMMWNNAVVGGVSATALGLPNVDGDTHRFSSIIVDGLGYVHLWANMHNDVMRYTKSFQTMGQVLNPQNAWTGQQAMPGQDNANTYPTPVRLRDGTIFLLMRSGPAPSQSARCDTHFWKLGPNSTGWSAKTKLLRGVSIPGAGPLKTPPGPPGSIGTDQNTEDSSNFSAYTTMPTLDLQGRLHLGFLWRQDTTGPNTGARSNFFPSYIYSDNGGTTWKASDGTVMVLPIDPVNFANPPNLACQLRDQAGALIAHPQTYAGGTTQYPNTQYVNNGGIAIDPATGDPHMVMSANPWFHTWFEGTLGQPGGFWHQDFIRDGATGGNGGKLNTYSMLSTMNCYWLRDALWVLMKVSNPVVHYRLLRVDGSASVAMSHALADGVPLAGQTSPFAGTWYAHADPEAFLRSGSVEVLLPDGDFPRIYSFGNGAKRYPFLPPAVQITGLAPNSGTSAGGTTVTITGTNLAGATSVTFAGTAATISTNTATQITCTSPAGTAGNAGVVVTTPAGTSPAVTYSYTGGGIPAPISVLGGDNGYTAYGTAPGLAHTFGVLRDVTVPLTIDSTGATDVTAALNAFCLPPAQGGSVPDGTRINLQPNGQYRIDKTWLFTDRNYIVIEFNGATVFTNIDRPFGSDPNEPGPTHTAAWKNDRTRAHLKFLRGSNVKIVNGEIRGPAAGRAGHDGLYIGSQEAQQCIDIEGTANVEIAKMLLHESWGELVNLVRPAGGPCVTNALVRDNTLKSNGMQGITIIGCIDGLIQRNKIYDIRRHAFDFEPVNTAATTTGNVIRNNDIGPSLLGFVANTPFLGLGPITHDNVVDGNRLDGTDPVVGVTPLNVVLDWSQAVKKNPANRLGKWTFTNNKSAGASFNTPRRCALLARHVDGLICTGNKWNLSLFPTNSQFQMYGVGGGDNTAVEVHDNNFFNGLGEIDPVPSVP